MTTRGVHKTETTTVTTRMLGIFKEDQAMEERFFRLIKP
jgi:GTP cyclohydrolase I